MTGRFLKRIQQDVHQHFGVDNGLAFKLRRVKSSDLVTAGIAEMIGGADALAALSDVREQQAIEGAKDEASREKQAKISRRAAEAQMAKLQQAITRSPERLREFAERVDAYCCAAIVAAGEWAGGADRVIDASEASYFEPVRFVMTEAEADHAEGRVWIVDLPEGVRQAVCKAAQELTSARSAVRPFRQATGPAADVA